MQQQQQKPGIFQSPHVKVYYRTMRKRLQQCVCVVRLPGESCFFFFLDFVSSSFIFFLFQEKESIAKCIADLKVLAKTTQAKAAA